MIVCCEAAHYHKAIYLMYLAMLSAPQMTN
jgi:hypothetical protein